MFPQFSVTYRTEDGYAESVDGRDSSSAVADR